MTNLALLFGLGVATALATLAGGVLAIRLSGRLHLILGLSAGAVLGVALFDLLPEALTLGVQADPRHLIAIAAVGFLAYMVLDRAMLLIAKGEPAHRGHVGAASLTAHSLMDGLAIGLGFQASAAAGVVLAAAVLAHDFADGANTVTVAQLGGPSRTRARAWLAADAAAPLAGIGLSLLIAPPAGALAWSLALFAGVFLYIGATELLPESHRRHPSLWTTVSTLLGAGLIWVVVRLASG